MCIRDRSKSLGNTVSPDDVIKQYGADILRLWVSQSDYTSDLRIGKEILKGVYFNLKKIDLILKSSLKDKSKVQSFDKLLLSIFRCAIYEIEVKKEISKKIVISEYLLISNHFFGNKEATLLNGVLDNLR